MLQSDLAQVYQLTDTTMTTVLKFGRIFIIIYCIVSSQQAQSQGPEVVIKYHNTTNCSGGEETEVRTRSRLCNIVPGSPNRSGYTVICNSEGNGGEARFCNDTTCNNCPGRFTFKDNQCTAIDPSYGSSAAQVCNHVSSFPMWFYCDSLASFLRSLIARVETKAVQSPLL